MAYEFTHTHNIISLTKEKYIITGWYNFIMSNDAYLGNPNLKKVNTPVEF